MYPSEWPRGTSIVLKNSSEIRLDTELYLSAKGIFSSTLQEVVSDESRRRKITREKRSLSVSAPVMNPLALTGAVQNPCTMHRVPSEMVVRDRIRESSVRVLPTHDLAIEHFVPGVLPSNECVR